MLKKFCLFNVSVCSRVSGLMAYTDLTSSNRKQREEAELYASLKQAREAARKLEAEKQKAEEEEKIRVEQLRVNIDMMQIRVNIDNTIQAK